MGERDETFGADPVHLRSAVVTDSAGVVEADIVIWPDQLRISFSTASRPVSIDVWRQLLDQVRELPALADRQDFNAALPIGDGELLDALRERCQILEARAAGASVLASGVFSGPWHERRRPAP